LNGTLEGKKYILPGKLKKMLMFPPSFYHFTYFAVPQHTCMQSVMVSIFPLKKTATLIKLKMLLKAGTGCYRNVYKFQQLMLQLSYTVINVTVSVG
jgi:hypothetical protein